MPIARTSHGRTPSRAYLGGRSEEHTSELQSQSNLVCRLLLEKKKTTSCIEPSLAAHILTSHAISPGDYVLDFGSGTRCFPMDRRYDYCGGHVHAVLSVRDFVS